jgi:hypothetical protein
VTTCGACRVRQKGLAALTAGAEDGVALCWLRRQAAPINQKTSLTKMIAAVIEDPKEASKLPHDDGFGREVARRNRKTITR